ncbi:MAG: toll/interleukin-1 receptor domain-containing protein [Chloroflexi bacterium]|nr:toll/interleukin-1 receptor domain-containing protein [Chloroflexota bacterium]
MAEIFVSYGRANMAFARQLVDRLEKRGVDVWIDVDDIRPGDHWGHKIQAALNECQVLLLIVTPDAMESRTVDDEWRYFHLQNKPIIPILRETTEVSWGLDYLQYIDFREEQDQDRAFRQLLTALGSDDAAFSQLAAPDEREPLPDEQPPLAVRHDRPNGGALAKRKPPLVQSRAEYNRPEDMIDNVRQVLWLSGISISRVGQHTESFGTLLRRRQGCAWFLLVDPHDDAVIQETSAYVGQSPDRLQRRLFLNLDDLADLKAQFPGQVQLDLGEEIWPLLDHTPGEALPQVEIRTLNHRPSVGYFISDPHLDAGIMTVSPYFYQIDKVKAGMDSRDPVSEPPFLHLSSLAHPEWYRVYLRDFLRLWESARPWPG